MTKIGFQGFYHLICTLEAAERERRLAKRIAELKAMPEVNTVWCDESTPLSQSPKADQWKAD